jgi:predicted transcriptional regulator
MPPTADARKTRFLKALIDAGMSQAAWARQIGISPPHLSQVLAGKRDSMTLVEKIDAFTRKYAKAS